MSLPSLAADALRPCWRGSQGKREGCPSQFVGLGLVLAVFFRGGNVLLGNCEGGTL